MQHSTKDFKMCDVTFKVKNKTSEYWNNDNRKFRNANECRDVVYIVTHSPPSHI